MPIEIKELHIRINVSNDAGQPAASAAPANSKEEIIEACVEQIMEILDRKEER